MKRWTCFLFTIFLFSPALATDWEKYPDTVKVYKFEDANGNNWSEELCGGPHVANTNDIAALGTFKIKKEESSSAGVRRIKAFVK